VGSYGIDEETLALARRWGVTIVPDDEIEDDGYPMRPSEEEHANNQWEIQESFYQEPPQISQPIDEDMRYMMNALLMQMNELQVQLETMKAQRKGLATQEPIQELSSNGEVLQELFLPNEGHVVDKNEKEGEDLEDEDDVVYDECIEMETPSGEESVELQGNGDKVQLEDGPNEEMLKNDKSDEICGTNEECPSMNDTPLGENFRITWEPGGVNVFESVGPHWPIFISKDSYFLLVHNDDPRFPLLAQEKGNQEKNGNGDFGISQSHLYHQEAMFRKKSLFDLWIKNGFEERSMEFEMKSNVILAIEVVSLCMKEFIDGHHLKTYLEEKFARKDGMFFLQSNDG